MDQSMKKIGLIGGMTCGIPAPLYDTTEIHAPAAVNLVLV